MSIDLDSYFNQTYDSLPYIDTDFSDDPKLKSTVTSLLMDSLQKSKVRFAEFQKQVNDRYAIPNDSNTLFFANDLAELETSGTAPTFSRIDHTERYNLSTLPQLTNAVDISPQGWKDITNKYATALEYHNKHYVQLELIRRFGKQAWKKGLSNDKETIGQITHIHDIIEQHNDRVNTARRFRQDQIKPQFEQVENDSISLIDHNFALATQIYIKSDQEYNEKNKKQKLQ